MFDFIADLDGYFCEKYANYDKICVLPDYKMPKMQTSEVREDGRTYAYTLPANTMRLALQEKKAELLQALKSRLTDKTFSFSFRTHGFFARMKNRRSKYGTVKWLKSLLAKYNETADSAFACLSIDREIWDGIVSGKFLPTKNLVFSLVLTMGMTEEDMENFLAVCGYELDFTMEKDVVISYLVHAKIFNPEMVKAALDEYKITNLFIK